jgi:hypothetical protein
MRSRLPARERVSPLIVRVTTSVPKAVSAPSGPGEGSGGARLPEAVRCPRCGVGSHPAAACCAACGAALRPAVPTPARWEYLDARIPLGTDGISPFDEGFLDTFDAFMTAALAAHGREGREPASPSDWREIVAAGRFVAGMRGPRWWPLPGLWGGRPVVREVLVRFRRPA